MSMTAATPSATDDLERSQETSGDAWTRDILALDNPIFQKYDHFARKWDIPNAALENAKVFSLWIPGSACHIPAQSH